jgi:hypothetical protein
MVYNEYGELVDAQSVLNPPKSNDMTVTQTLRVIKKGFHHDVSALVSPSATQQCIGILFLTLSAVSKSDG